MSARNNPSDVIAELTLSSYKNNVDEHDTHVEDRNRYPEKGVLPLKSYKTTSIKSVIKFPLQGKYYSHML